MDWLLIFTLSLFGLAMGVATVFVIPSNIEPLFWLAIFVVCAYVIAMRAPGRPFLHGLFVSIVNSVWITGAHVLLFNSYLASHPKEAAIMSSTPLANHSRMLMAVTGPVVGVISGLVLGLFSLVAAKIVGKAPSGGNA